MNAETVPPLFIFTHIPKTAGTSLFERVIRPNFAERETLGAGVREFWSSFKAHHRVVSGHVGYGLHWLTRRRAVYLTFLRDPIERAISHYFFIRQCNPAYCEHDRYDDATSCTLAEFYLLPRYQNEMTRMLAGFPIERLALYLNSSACDRWAYNVARRRLLHDYDCFGIKERFEESAEHIRSRYGWQATPHHERMKKTRGRLNVTDLDEATLRTLRKAHQYDVRLYEYAWMLLDDRLRAAPSDSQ